MSGQSVEHRRAIFSQFFEENFATIVRYVYRRVESHSVAEEIAADVFTVAWEKFDVARPFDLPWLYRTAMNKVMNHWTRNRNRRDASSALAQLAEESAHAINPFDQIELRQAITRLPRREAEALRLTVWEGLDGKEASKVLGCSLAAYWKLMSRARQNLKALLSPMDSALDDRKETGNARR